MPMLEPELQSLLTRNLELTQENNRLLRSMRRMAFWGGVLRFVWWALILLVLPFAAYYFYLAPYVTEFMQGVREVQGIRAGFESSDPFSSLREMYEQYRAAQGQ